MIEHTNALEKHVINLTEELVAAETLAKSVENDLEGQIIDLSKELEIANDRADAAENELADMNNVGFSDPTLLNQNIVTANPKMNQVTFEIHKELVGKYVVEGNPEMYFEIKPDGKATISLETFEGFARYHSNYFQLTAFYDFEFDVVYLNFNLINGKATFPANCGLSVSFKGNTNFTSFISTDYLPDSYIAFIKQK